MLWSTWGGTGVPGQDGDEGGQVRPVGICLPALFFQVFTVMMSCLGRRINIKLADGSFKLHGVLVNLPKEERPMWIQCLVLFKMQIRMYSVLPTRSK